MSAWLNGPGWHSAVFIIAAILVIIGAVLTVAVCWYAHDNDPELEADLDALSPLPPMPEADLVGADRDPDPRTPAAGVAASEDPRLADGGVGTQGMCPVEAGTPVLYGRPIAKLSGKQSRRAQRKGRIPRDSVLRPGPEVSLGRNPGAARADLAGGVAPAPAAGQHHMPDRVFDQIEESFTRFRRAEAAQFWTQLARDRDTAYQAWADGFARLERTDWLELAA